MTLLILLHLVLGIAGLIWGERLGRRALFLGVVGPLAATVWLLAVLPGVVDGEVLTEDVAWMPSLGVDFSLRLDGFAALMVSLVSGIGVLIYAYAYRYFPPQGPALGRLVALLTLFSGSMFGLVVADNLLVLYGFWELTSITSFLLIGNNNRDGRARAAALQALLITSAGALAMLVGFIVLGQAAGTYRLSDILANPPGGDAVTVALVLILAGAFTKSAQYPFHGWLPGAMVAPTPVSAYLHSATMVKAGVYLVARLSPAFVDVGLWRPLVVTVGLVTMIVGGARALRQNDLKLLLAMGTVSQLGFMTAVFGLGTPAAMEAGCVLVLAHALFKATAFMVVGILDHQYGTRDIALLPRPGAGWILTTVATVVAAASMAGIPMFAGFIAKEADLAAFVHEEGVGISIALVVIVVGSAFTVAYSLRFALGALGRLNPTPAATPAVPNPPAHSFVAPALLLAGMTVLFGIVPGVLDRFMSAAAGSLDASARGVHLALWHGFNLPLLLSAIAIASGAALYVLRQRVDPVLARAQPTTGTSSVGYHASLRGLNALSNHVSRVVQSGSLPVYLGVILLTATLMPAAFLITGDTLGPWPHLVDQWTHIPVIAVALGAAVAASLIHRRFTAALFLGVVGYSMAALFVMIGAPDLALTQVGIESLSTVLFVLVLRRLPDRFDTAVPWWRKSMRMAVAGTVGLMVFAFALSTGAQKPDTVASDVYIERSLPDGGGKNVVNVILVDFRGFDTLGEITVLAAAAIGTVALARAGRARVASRSSERSSVPAVVTPEPVLVARLPTLDVTIRTVFTVVMVGSIYLLFAGHNQPGGGFAGGIVAGAAVTLRYISGGLPEVRKISRGRPWRVLGIGVLMASVTALIPLLFGQSVLEGTYWEFDPPLLGHVKLTSALPFDIGVYLVVVGLALMMFESFGDDSAPVDQHAATEAPEPNEPGPTVATPTVMVPQ